MTIWGYSSSSLERVRRDHRQPAEGDRGHQVPADGVAEPARVLHPGHLQQDEGDGKCSGGSAGILLCSWSSFKCVGNIRINCTSWINHGRIIWSSTASTRWRTRKRNLIWSSLEWGKFWGKSNIIKSDGSHSGNNSKNNCFVWLLKYLLKLIYNV